MGQIIIATIIVGAVGLLIGVFLSIAADKFYVPVDEKEAGVRKVLPGNNCGGCGFPGCDGLAAAIAKGEADINACPVGGSDVAKRIGEIMGVEAKEGAEVTAFVKCAGNCQAAKLGYEYTGVKDCVDASYATGKGPKACNYGCTGFGNCVKACPFDAIHIVDGIALVDEDACKACGKCVVACPKHLIEIVPKEKKYRVHCSSQDKGKSVKDVCQKGCIGCGLCARFCPENAITVVNNIAHIDYDKCTNCGTCSEKCPVKII